MHRKVKYIVDHQACLGCGLCLKPGTKSSMKLYDDGYYHPSENASIDENIQKYCPGYGIHQEQKKSKKWNSFMDQLWLQFLPDIL